MNDLISRQMALRTDCFGDGHDGLRAFHVYEDYLKMRKYLESLPSVQPKTEERTEKSAQNVPNNDLISRKAAIDAIFSEPLYESGMKKRDADKVVPAIYEKIKSLPPAQPEQQHGRVFQGIVVEYPSYNTYPEYKGKPYFSIKYTENGQEFIGYGTYKPEVLSEYLKEYFMSPAQPSDEYDRGWKEGREALREETWEYVRDRFD